MPYTASQLAQFYNNLTFGNPPSATTTAVFNSASSQDAAGTITDAQAFAAVNYMLTGVRSTVDVAVSTYALFTGATPTQAGINYLINNPGTGYNTSYYNGVGGSAAAPGPGGFDAENRYFNAAINLAGTTGAVGNAAFVQTYGSLSLAQTISTAYSQIIGVPAVGSTAAEAAITAISGSLPYFQTLGAQRVGVGSSVDITTKAIIVGYILEEAIKADVGTYAKALDGFNFALANGVAVFNTNLLASYGSGGTSFNPAAQPLNSGQTLTATGATITSVGVAANGFATLNVGSNATINLTGDIAVNNGQLFLSVANASAGSALSLNFTGQILAAPASIVATGVGTVNLSAQTASATPPAGTVLSLDLQDPSLTTLNISGNERVAYSAPLYAFADSTMSTGALTTINASAATAPATLDVSSFTGVANNTASGGVTVTGTTGADTIMVRNFATVTGNGGNDTIMVSVAASLSSLSRVTDDHAGVVVGFAGFKPASFNATAITATSVQNGLDQAAARGVGTISYFQVGGDTYLVADNSPASTFQFNPMDPTQPGGDFALRLVGVHNLTTSALGAQGLLTLGG